MLSFILSLLVCIPVYAGEPNEEIVLIDRGHGEYSESTSFIENIFVGEEDKIVATATEDEELYYIEDNEYAAEVDENTYQLVERTDIDVDSFDSTDAELSDIPDNVIEELETTIAEQKELGNDEFEVSLFSTSQQWSDDIHTVNGLRYRNYFIKYWDLKAAVNYNGSGTRSVASNVINLAISCAGLRWTSVGIFGAAKSLYDLFADTYGSVSGTSSDVATAIMLWDKLWKSTHRVDGPYYNSVSTEKVWLNKSTFTLTLGSKFLTKVASLNCIIYSPRFNDPYSWLWYYSYSDSDAILSTILLTTYVRL